MTEIMEKIMKSGIIEKSAVELLEQWGYIKPGSASLVDEDKLKDATVATLTNMAKDLSYEIVKERLLKEGRLEVDSLRWPVVVSIYETVQNSLASKLLADSINALIDSFGRYYFRYEDVKESWFKPSNVISKKGGSKYELIRESQNLSNATSIVCIQVATIAQETKLDPVES